MGVFYIILFSSILAIYAFAIYAYAIAPKKGGKRRQINYFK